MNAIEKNAEELANHSRELEFLKAEHARVMASTQGYDIVFFNRSTIYIAGMLVAIISIVNGAALNEYAAVALPFFLEYYAYSTIKYTIRTQELDGYAQALESRINATLSAPVLFEYDGLKSKNHWSVTWGAGIQIVFVIPIAIIAAALFYRAIVSIAFPPYLKWCIAAMCALGAAMVLVMIAVPLMNRKRKTVIAYESWLAEQTKEKKEAGK